LLEDTAECAGRQILASFSSDGHATGLRRMFELSVTAFHRNQVPTIACEEPQDFRYLQRGSLPDSSRGG